MRWILSILLNSLILIVVAGYLDKFHLDGIAAALLASVLLAILNMIVKPILIILTLPVTVLSLGLFLFVINGITLMLTQGIMGDSFVIDSFGTAMFAAIIISLLNLLIQKVIIDPMKEKKR